MQLLLINTLDAYTIEKKERKREHYFLLDSSIKQSFVFNSLSLYKCRQHTGSTPNVCKPSLTAPVNSGK